MEYIDEVSQGSDVMTSVTTLQDRRKTLSHLLHLRVKEPEGMVMAKADDFAVLQHRRLMDLCTLDVALCLRRRGRDSHHALYISYDRVVRQYRGSNHLKNNRRASS